MPAVSMPGGRARAGEDVDDFDEHPTNTLRIAMTIVVTRSFTSDSIPEEAKTSRGLMTSFLGRQDGRKGQTTAIWGRQPCPPPMTSPCSTIVVAVRRAAPNVASESKRSDRPP